MADFRKLVAVSLLAGLLGGLLLSVLQHYQTLPLILAAEQFETPSAEHVHDWQPMDGWQRNGFTLLFNGLTGFGFALLISASMYWRDQRGYLYGLGWGLAGYWVFYVAPSLGLPPELPGTDSAELHSRQAWWLFTAAATAIGLFGLFFDQTALVANRRRWLTGLTASDRRTASGGCPGFSARSLTTAFCGVDIHQQRYFLADLGRNIGPIVA